MTTKAISRKDVPRLSLPPAGGGEVGGSGAGRGTLAHSAGLGFPPPTSPRGGRPEQSPGTEDTEVGCSFAEIA